MVGDIILFKTPFYLLKPMSWLAALIRLFTGSPYNHAGIVHEINGRLFFCEADENGVHTELLESRLEGSKSKILILRPRFNFNAEIINFNCENILGRKYGEWLLIKYAFAILTGQPMRSEEARKGNTFVCTHVAAYVHGLNNWWRTSPKELYNDPRFIKI